MNPLQSKLSELSEETKIRLYNNIFSTGDGQIILEDLKLRAFYYVSTADPRFAKTSDEVLINEGTRKLLLYIIEMSQPLTEIETKGETNA